MAGVTMEITMRYQEDHRWKESRYPVADGSIPDLLRRMMDQPETVPGAVLEGETRCGRMKVRTCG
jgi:hypothetical protein